MPTSPSDGCPEREALGSELTIVIARALALASPPIRGGTRIWHRDDPSLENLQRY